MDKCTVAKEISGHPAFKHANRARAVSEFPPVVTISPLVQSATERASGVAAARRLPRHFHHLINALCGTVTTLSGHS